MRPVLLVGHAGQGHLNPLMAVARRLRRLGWHPVVASFGSEACRMVQDRGLESLALPAPRSALGARVLPYLSGPLETAFAFELFTAQPEGYARAVLEALRRLRPAALVADFLCPGAHLAAEAAGLPWLSLYHAGLAYPGPGLPPFGSGLPIGSAWGWRARLVSWLGDMAQARLRRRLLRARRALGLPGEDRCPHFWSSPWATLLLTAEEAEVPRYPLPPRTFFVGPCLPEPGPPAFPRNLLSAKPKVYVSLGTVFNNRPRVFRRLLEALLNSRYQVIVSAGAAYPQLRGYTHPDALIFPQVPQLEVLGLVDAVVCHGGNNTLNEALAAGLPLLVMPVGGEQADNAGRVVHLGAGLRADLHRAPPSEILTKVERLLQEPGFREQARRVGRALAGTDGAGTTVRFLQRIVETGKPVDRPPGYPATVPRDGPWPWEES